jgi:hypothetical protein
MTENENPVNDAPNTGNQDQGGGSEDVPVTQEPNPYANLDSVNPEPAWKSRDDPRSDNCDYEDKSTSQE